MIKIVFLALAVSVSSCGHVQQQPDTAASMINGITFVATSSPIDSSAIMRLKTTYRANHAAVVPYAMMRDLNSPEVIFDSERGWWGESTEGATKTIQMMHGQNIAVMLKPQIWVWHGEYTGHIKLETEAQWQQLETSYERYIMNYAKLAQDTQVALFCIGTELESFVAARPTYWNKLITKIKSVYKGKLTYASNWDSYALVPFWEQIDYIGVDAYFPMCDLKTPSATNARASWEKWKVDLSSLSRKRNKPILFTEYGYISADYAGAAPWKDARDEHEVNEQAQMVLLETMYEEVWGEDWFAGGYLWKHHTEIGRRSLDKQFSTQYKIAEKTVKKQYSK
jgi:hypothetical protein